MSKWKPIRAASEKKEISAPFRSRILHRISWDWLYLNSPGIFLIFFLLGFLILLIWVLT